MEKEFVPYEQALALKELGFDEPCFGFYNDMENNKPMGGNFPCDGRNSAPLYQQAFRWFREKHDLHSCVAPVYEDEISKVIVYWFWIQGFDSFEDEDINYKTPEEAELECLKKLIEIAKNK